MDVCYALVLAGIRLVGVLGSVLTRFPSLIALVLPRNLLALVLEELFDASIR